MRPPPRESANRLKLTDRINLKRCCAPYYGVASSGELYEYQENGRGEGKLYHIKFMNCAPENSQKLRENFKKFKRPEEVEFLGLFFPRGSNYMFAGITKYKDYATWEKYWAETAEERQKGISIITGQTDMFFDEIKL